MRGEEDKSPKIEPMVMDNTNIFLSNHCESDMITIVEPVIPSNSPHHSDVIVKNESLATEFVNSFINSPQPDPVNVANDTTTMPNFIDKNCFLILQNLPKLLMPGDKIIRVKAIQSDPGLTNESLSYEDVTHLVPVHSNSTLNPEVKSEKKDNGGKKGFIRSQPIKVNTSRPNLLALSKKCQNNISLKQEYNNLSYETKKLLVDTHARGEQFLKLAAQIGISNKTACNVIRKWYLPEKGDNKLKQGRPIGTKIIQPRTSYGLN